MGGSNVEQGFLVAPILAHRWILVLLVGLASEVKVRRIGPLTLIVFGLALVFGARELLGGVG